MKKILVLMLVLGIASTASAGLSFATGSATITVGESVSVALQIDSASVGASSLDNMVGYYSGTVATLAAPTQGADAIAFTVNTKTGAYAGYFQIISGTTVTGGFSLGDEVAIATLTGDAAGTYTIYSYMTSMWDITGGWDDSFTLTVNQIPVPMTFGLLGLGGLFLRRRK